jgi:hypothetical protein
MHFYHTTGIYPYIVLLVVQVQGIRRGRMTYCYYQGKAHSCTVACLLLVLLYLTGLLTRSTYILTRSPVRDGSALRCLGRRKVEEARFLLVTVHYGTVLGWMLCICPYTGTSLVPCRKLTTTVTMNTESSPGSTSSTYSSLVPCNSTGLLEPKTYTFK